jgi:hypothetical protein
LHLVGLGVAGDGRDPQRRWRGRRCRCCCR